MSKEYYPSWPGPLVCFLCDTPVESGTWSRKQEPFFVHDKQEWMDAWSRHSQHLSKRNRKFTLNLRPSDIAAPFRLPRAWATFFRVIVLSKPGNRYLSPGVHLSGIAWVPGARSMDGYLLAPKDPNAACLGAVRRDCRALPISSIPHPVANYRYNESLLNGYVLHSRCWDLIELRLGPLATRLDLIASAFRDQWRDYFTHVDNGVDTTTIEDRLKYSSCYSLNHSELRDPRFIPEVDSILREAQLLTNESVNKSFRNLLTFTYRAPLEIQYLIAEYLTLTETYDMLTAFDEVRFSVNFWKRHVPTDYIFELVGVHNDNPSFWAYIAAELQRRGLLVEGAADGAGWNRQWTQIKISHVGNRVLDAVDREQQSTRSPDT